MTVLNPKAFRLPRVEKEKFILLLRLGLDYNRAQGTFCISNYNNIEKLIDTLSEILQDDVSFMQTCLVCGKDFPCQDCRYVDTCDTKNLPFRCVCSECLKTGKSPRESS
ncbi:MAG: hypothetical protein ACE14S_05050 [Candidatus Bathyarchaeia archaeon]